MAKRTCGTPGVGVVLVLAACGSGAGGGTDAAPGDVVGPEDAVEAVEPGVADVSAKFPTCVDLFPCTSGCADDACRKACMDGASAQARADLLAAKACLDAACPVCAIASPTPQQKQECEGCRGGAVFGTCSQDFRKCIAGGPDACPKVLACVEACPDDGCAEACVSNASFDAKTLLLAIIGCMEQACGGQLGQPWNACMQASATGACKAEFEACAAAM